MFLTNVALHMLHKYLFSNYLVCYSSFLKQLFHILKMISHDCNLYRRQRLCIRAIFDDSSPQPHNRTGGALQQGPYTDTCRCGANLWNTKEPVQVTNFFSLFPIPMHSHMLAIHQNPVRIRLLTCYSNKVIGKANLKNKYLV